MVGGLNICGHNEAWESIVPDYNGHRVSSTNLSGYGYHDINGPPEPVQRHSQFLPGGSTSLPRFDIIYSSLQLCHSQRHCRFWLWKHNHQCALQRIPLGVPVSVLPGSRGYHRRCHTGRHLPARGFCRLRPGLEGCFHGELCRLWDQRRSCAGWKLCSIGFHRTVPRIDDDNQ